MGLSPAAQNRRNIASIYKTGTAANANNIIPVYVPIDVAPAVVIVLFARVVTEISILYLLYIFFSKIYIISIYILCAKNNKSIY